MYYLVDSEGSIIARNVSFDRLQDRVDRDMLEAWVLRDTEYQAIYNADEFFGDAGYGSVIGDVRAC